MTGEILKTEAICLDIRPWSRTSHVVSWLTPRGRVATVVKGAVRPKSLFLGQYDLNYTCDILYYARAHGELHALRECSPREFRSALRDDYQALALAGYFRLRLAELAPMGEECASWYRLLENSLDRLERRGGGDAAAKVAELVRFDLQVLKLAGLAPDFSGYDRGAEWSEFFVETGSFAAAEGRRIRVARAVAEYLSEPTARPRSDAVPLDAARVIGVFYQFHLDSAVDVRRTVLGMISKIKEGNGGL